MGKRRWKGV